MRRHLATLLLIIVSLGLASGCNKPEPKAPTNNQSSGQGQATQAVSPDDFFPMKTGSRWKYRIELGGIEPLAFRIDRWPVGGGKIVSYFTRGRYMAALKAIRNNEKGPFVLEYRVKGPVERQGELQYPEGVELEILKDELGVFQSRARPPKAIYWAKSHDWRVLRVQTLDGFSSPVQRGSFIGADDGSIIELVFFAERPMTSMSIGGRNSPDSLLLEGPSKGGARVTFVRKVEGQNDEDGEPDAVSKGFEEKITYEKGKGLVKLVQTVEGKTSMVWTLEEFDDGK